ncbi:hypothetical protein [Stenotrophomonas sp. JAI102]|uniref:hypothetical protein n=1 Tax=Stenotrophomonas sp. JAI102 TaxID=2723077 RepID=UPI0015C923FE|nr:hypothetical protein [Stenotrophomonas sp. JAI102]NYF35197.1 hypothetical protein [Stenotrophomonas sp. JAI102]
MSSLGALNARLDALETALRDENFDEAGLQLDALDAAQRDYLAGPSALFDVPGLSSLQARQQRIMLFMMRQREDASRHIHNGHQSLRAAQAYLTAESLS